MCIFCKSKMMKESTTTHVVDYKKSVIVIKMYLATNVINVVQNFILMKWLSISM